MVGFPSRNSPTSDDLFTYLVVDQPHLPPEAPRGGPGCTARDCRSSSQPRLPPHAPAGLKFWKHPMKHHHAHPHLTDRETGSGSHKQSAWRYAHVLTGARAHTHTCTLFCTHSHTCQGLRPPGGQAPSTPEMERENMLADTHFQWLPCRLPARGEDPGEQRMTGPWAAGLGGEEPRAVAMSCWPAGTVPSGGGGASRRLWLCPPRAARIN